MNAVLKPLPRVIPFVATPWKLTGMQCAVLFLLVDGHTYPSIAAELEISQKTAEKHLSRAKERMGAANTLQAALMFDRHFRDKTSPPASMVPNRFYLAGPMTGIHDLNFPAFHRHAAQLRAEGLEVINPAEINPDKHMAWTDCMRSDIAALVTCEGICLMPDWTFSKGATLEHHIAERLGLKVRHLGLLR